MATTLAFLGPIGYQELIIIAVIGLLIFGKRLPEVGRSLGKGIVEFKKGLSGIEDDVNNATNTDQTNPQQPSKLDAESNQSTTTSSTQNESTKTH